jgi:hypothetical protein
MVNIAYDREGRIEVVTHHISVYSPLAEPSVRVTPESADRAATVYVRLGSVALHINTLQAHELMRDLRTALADLRAREAANA